MKPEKLDSNKNIDRLSTKTSLVCDKLEDLPQGRLGCKVCTQRTSVAPTATSTTIFILLSLELSLEDPNTVVVVL